MDLEKITHYIEQSTRPNLHKLTEDKLESIIISYNYTALDEFDKYKKKPSRAELVDKIFELWSSHELKDHLDNPIECLICYDPLTNGNNLTFECGHKFHSGCVIKHLLVHSTDSYKNYLDDTEKTNIKIEYCCPQCKKIIDFVQFNKNS
jgi:hypothetical protein